MVVLIGKFRYGRDTIAVDVETADGFFTTAFGSRTGQVESEVAYRTRNNARSGLKTCRVFAVE